MSETPKRKKGWMKRVMLDCSRWCALTNAIHSLPSHALPEALKALAPVLAKYCVPKSPGESRDG